MHEDGSGPEKANCVTTICIASETNHVVMRDKLADSRVVLLSVKEKPDVSEEKCQYYIWRQVFPVKPEAKVSGRTDVEEWIVSLAFPFGNRLKRGTSSVGVFSFLPTSMVTNFPFVVQADFILASSRETIVFDSRWNRGILECVPDAFVNAFTSCVKEISPVCTITQAFDFLPAQLSPFPELNEVRGTIQRNLSDALIVPCETFSSEVTFCKPSSTVRILPRFREILFKMKEDGVSLVSISRMKHSLVHSSLDQDKNMSSLDFLGIQFTHGWYEECIITCNLAFQVSDDLYVDLLYFVFSNRVEFNIKYIPLIKYINEVGKLSLSTIREIQGGRKVIYGENEVLHAWLQKCNILFGCPKNIFFLPKFIQAVLTKHPNGKVVAGWLRSYGIKSCSATEYASLICDYASHRRELNVVLSFSHFLYHSNHKKFLTDSDVHSVLNSIPIIDGSGSVKVFRIETLVPAQGSKWAVLLGPVNPFLKADYVDIGEAYAASGQFAGEQTADGLLLNFLTVNARARDLPEVSPPNLPLRVASSTLSREQAFLLLDWLRFHKTRGSSIPERFFDSICFGKWMKTKSGVDCPSRCTIPDESGRLLLELVKGVLIHISIVDEDFYGDQINSYRDEFKFLGVRCGIHDVQEIVKDRFKVLSSVPMTRESTLSLLLFIGFLKGRKMLDEQWLDTITKRIWITTCRGHAAPRRSIFFLSDMEAEAAKEVTSLPIIDNNFYGGKLHSFHDELKLLGVKSESEVYALVVGNLDFPNNPSSLSPSSGLFLLNCLRNEKSPVNSFIEKVQNTPWLKTNSGFKCPSEAILYGPDWNCLLKIVEVPVIDESFYGDGIRSYIAELKAVGVGVESEVILKIVVKELKSLLSSLGTPEHLIALLNCMSEMRKIDSSLLHDMSKHLHEEEILKTRHGYKKPRESILFNSKWASISLFVDFPLIDDSYYGIKIYGFRDEMKLLGVLSSLEEGAMFVPVGLSGPIESALLTAESTLSFLDCLKILMANADDHPCLGAFIEHMVRSELLMTSSGYRLPQSCLLYQSAWTEMLELTDAPFINDKFYITDMSDYFSQLKVIGVKVDPMEVCNVLSESLALLAETSQIKRIYLFLKEFQWKPNSPGIPEELQIWIPAMEESDEGQWVNSCQCVLHEKDHYFGTVLYSLDKYYEKEVLSFFSATYGVREFPLTSHYLQLWSLWEQTEAKEISDAECCFFWGYILKNWNSETKNVLTSTAAKVPAMSADRGILLVSKENVFVPDDLLLKKMFMNVGDSPLFVWFPKTSALSGVPTMKLCEVYYALGVRKMSESVTCIVTMMQSSGPQSKDDQREH